MNARPLVIVGGGQAGFTLATRLRDLGDRRRIVLVDGEGTAPYSRPPLSKEYLVATKAAGDLLFRPESYYAAQDIELRLGVTATGIDPGTRTVTLSGGDVLGYADLVLCTGAEPRTLPLAGCDEVVTVYRREDTDRLRTILAVANSIVCIGGGFIGLEVAAAAAKHNVHTSLRDIAGTAADLSRQGRGRRGLPAATATADPGAGARRLHRREERGAGAVAAGRGDMTRESSPRLR